MNRYSAFSMTLYLLASSVFFASLVHGQAYGFSFPNQTNSADQNLVFALGQSINVQWDAPFEPVTLAYNSATNGEFGIIGQNITGSNFDWLLNFNGSSGTKGNYTLILQPEDEAVTLSPDMEAYYSAEFQVEDAGDSPLPAQFQLKRAANSAAASTTVVAEALPAAAKTRSNKDTSPTSTSSDASNTVITTSMEIISLNSQGSIITLESPLTLTILGSMPTSPLSNTKQTAAPSLSATVSENLSLGPGITSSQTASATSTVAPSANQQENTGLSPGAKAGIGVVVTIIILTAAGAVGVFLIRRREDRRRASLARHVNQQSWDYGCDGPQELAGFCHGNRLPKDYTPPARGLGLRCPLKTPGGTSIYELPTTEDMPLPPLPSELPGSDKEIEHDTPLPAAATANAADTDTNVKTGDSVGNSADDNSSTKGSVIIGGGIPVWEAGTFTSSSSKPSSSTSSSSASASASASSSSQNRARPLSTATGDEEAISPRTEIPPMPQLLPPLRPFSPMEKEGDSR